MTTSGGLGVGTKILGLENLSSGTSTTYVNSLYVDTTGALRYGNTNAARTESYLIGPDVTDNMFRNVTVTFQSGNQAMYVNNAIVASGTITTNIASGNGYWRIGGFKNVNYTNGIDGTFTGDIADVQIFNRILSSGERYQNYLNLQPTYNNLNTFAFTGSGQTYNVPSGMTKLGVYLTAPRGGVSRSQTGSGGGGGTIFVNLDVTPGQRYDVVVGERGSNISGNIIYGGGGRGGLRLAGGNNPGGDGGGLTGIFTSGAVNFLRSGTPIVVVGGGGGGADSPYQSGNWGGGNANATIVSGGAYGQNGRERSTTTYGRNAGVGGYLLSGGIPGENNDSQATVPGSGTYLGGGQGGYGFRSGDIGGGGGGGGYYGGGGGAGASSGSDFEATGGGGAGSTFFSSGTIKYGELNFSNNNGTVKIQAFPQ
jgi:hypothetical protein